MPFKQIVLKEKVHRRLKRVADANKRSIAGQVEYLLDLQPECPHPDNMREQLVVVENVHANQASRTFVVCTQCNRVIS